MEVTDKQRKLWSAAETYTMAAICLVLGVGIGYLLHTPEPGKSGAPVAATAPVTAPGGASPSMPSAEDMKRMAEKQVAPLLANLQKDPNNVELLEKIARLYFAAQQYQNAQQYYERAAALKPSPDALNELAFDYFTLGDVDKAIDTLNRALKIDPKNPKVLFNLGMFEWHGKSDAQAAIAAWEDFVKADPTNPKRADVEKLISQAKRHLNLPPGAKTDKPAM